MPLPPWPRGRRAAPDQASNWTLLLSVATVILVGLIAKVLADGGSLVEAVLIFVADIALIAAGIGAAFLWGRMSRRL